MAAVWGNKRLSTEGTGKPSLLKTWKEPRAEFPWGNKEVPGLFVEGSIASWSIL